MKTRLFPRGPWLAVLLLACLPMALSAQPAAAPVHPQFVVQTLDGKTFDLAAERGKWVIVNFWATWCSPCIAEMPAISRFVATHPNVVAIGLAYDRTPRAEILEFVRNHPVAYPLAQLDPGHPPTGIAMPEGLPTTDLIAPDGTLARHFIGPVDEALLSQAIRRPAAAPTGR